MMKVKGDCLRCQTPFEITHEADVWTATGCEHVKMLWDGVGASAEKFLAQFGTPAFGFPRGIDNVELEGAEEADPICMCDHGMRKHVHVNLGGDGREYGPCSVCPCRTFRATASVGAWPA